MKNDILGVAMRGLTFAVVSVFTLLAPYAAEAQRKPPAAPTTSTLQGTITIDPSCDMLGTVIYFAGRSYQTRLGISTAFSTSGRPQSAFQIDDVPVNASLLTLTIEVPYASTPSVTAEFALPTSSVTQLGTINYPGTCGAGGAIPKSCTLNSQCNDDNRCTSDRCSSGTCASTPITCNDGNSSTIDSCNPSVGCVFTPTVCGDGTKSSNEACDDGNVSAGDGCSAGCTVESGFSCSGSPSVCASVCGDGVKTSTEACDDGNTSVGDGCTASCQVEAGFTCNGSPSACSPIAGYCTVAATCPGVSIATCFVSACTNNQCGTVPAFAGTVCEFGKTCDGSGNCR